MAKWSQALNFYLFIFGALVVISSAQAAWCGVLEFFEDGRFRRFWQRLISGDLLLDFLDDLGTFAVDVLFLLPYIALFVAGAFVVEEFLKTRVALWGVMAGVAAWTSLCAYIAQRELAEKHTPPVCELIIEPKVYSLFHHEGYKRYYDLNKHKIDRLWGREEPLATGQDAADDEACRRQHALGLWSQTIRFIIKDRLVWADFFQKTFLDELSFGAQMFANPFPEPGGDAEPHLQMTTKNGLLQFRFNYPQKRYDGTDECLIADFPLRIFSQLPVQLMNFRGKDHRQSQSEYRILRRANSRRSSKLREKLLEKCKFARTVKWRADWYTDSDGDSVGCPTDDGFALFENEYFVIKFKLWS